MSNEKQLPPCDAEVFEKGESIGLFPGVPKEDIERLCKGLSAATGWRIDWSYFAGRPHIRALSPAEQFPGLPTAWFDPGYQEFITAEGRAATLRIGDGDRLARYSVPLFTGAQAGEVVALRSALLRAGEREHELRTALARCKSWIESARDGVLYPIANDFSGVVGRNAEGLGQQSAGLLEAITEILPASAEPADTCAHSYANELGCPECGKAFSVEPSAPVDRAELTRMVDAAMREMSNIHPPLGRGDCARLIRAAMARQPLQFAGIPVVVDPNVPNGEVHLHGTSEWKRRAIEAESKLRTYDPQVLEMSAQAMDALFAAPKPAELVLTKCKLCDQLQADLTARDEQNDQLRMDAGRYRWLRSRDLDAIGQGGVFAGLTPDNLVLNEETLDQAVDASMRTTSPCGGGANIGQAGQEVMHISDLGSDATCGVCYDTGHIITNDTGPDYVTEPCPECELGKQAGHGQ